MEGRIRKYANQRDNEEQNIKIEQLEEEKRTE